MRRPTAPSRERRQIARPRARYPVSPHPTTACRPSQQRANARTGAQRLLLCREAGVSPCAPAGRPVRASGATVRSLSQPGEAVAHLIASLIINHTADRHRRLAAGRPGDRRRRERRCARPSMLTTTGFGEPGPRPRAPILRRQTRAPRRATVGRRDTLVPIFARGAANRQQAAVAFRRPAHERGRRDRRPCRGAALALASPTSFTIRRTRWPRRSPTGSSTRSDHADRRVRWSDRGSRAVSACSWPRRSMSQNAQAAARPYARNHASGSSGRSPSLATAI